MISRRTVLVGISSGLVAVASGLRAQSRPTPTGDIGPYYPVGYRGETDNDLTLIRGHSGRAAGQVIEVSGRVLDVRGNPVRSARIELWQANAAGRYSHSGDANPAPLDPNFQGYARITSGRDGSYRYTTIKPGAYPDGDDSPRPPHIHLDVTGQKDRLVSQMLFPDEPLNDTDDVVPNWARERLTATALDAGASGIARFRWDIILDQG